MEKHEHKCPICEEEFDCDLLGCEEQKDDVCDDCAE